VFPLAETPQIYFALGYVLASAAVAVRAVTLVPEDLRPRAGVLALALSALMLLSWFVFPADLPVAERRASTLLFGGYLLLTMTVGLLGHGRFLTRAWLEEMPRDDPRLRRRTRVIVAQMLVPLLLLPILVEVADPFPGFVLPGFA
jgi:hypothetical protein